MLCWNYKRTLPSCRNQSHLLLPLKLILHSSYYCHLIFVRIEAFIALLDYLRYHSQSLTRQSLSCMLSCGGLKSLNEKLHYLGHHTCGVLLFISCFFFSSIPFRSNLSKIIVDMDSRFGIANFLSLAWKQVVDQRHYLVLFRVTLDCNFLLSSFSWTFLLG